jgi:hypothetical protein
VFTDNPKLKMNVHGRRHSRIFRKLQGLRPPNYPPLPAQTTNLPRFLLLSQGSGMAAGKGRVPSPGGIPFDGIEGGSAGCSAGVGVNRVPPGFARPRADVGDPLLDRAASRVPANPVDDPT